MTANLLLGAYCKSARDDTDKYWDLSPRTLTSRCHEFSIPESTSRNAVDEVNAETGEIPMGRESLRVSDSKRSGSYDDEELEVIDEAGSPLRLVCDHHMFKD